MPEPDGRSPGAKYFVSLGLDTLSDPIAQILDKQGYFSDADLKNKFKRCP